jgi:hypothetical protein
LVGSAQLYFDGGASYELDLGGGFQLGMFARMAALMSPHEKSTIWGELGPQLSLKW